MRTRLFPSCIIVLFVCACSRHGVTPPLAGGTLPQLQPALNASQDLSAQASPLVGPPYGTNLPVLQFPTPTTHSGPQGMAFGSDGNVWFVESVVGKIGRITPSGGIQEYSGISSSAQLVSIAAGAPGTLWFTGYNANQIGVITTAGTLQTYFVPTPSSHPYGLVMGPDGNIWFTESTGNKIGRLTPGHGFTEFRLPHANSTPLGITVGPDSNLWFAERVGRIGRITTAGAIHEFAVTGQPRFITSAADGALWFTEVGDTVGRITTTGTTRTLPLSTGAKPSFITRGSDGNAWFTESGLNDIRYVDVKTGTLTAPFAVPASSQPDGIVAAYGNIYFTEYSASNVGQLDLQAARGLSATVIDLGVNLYPNAINRYGTVVGFSNAGINTTDAAIMYSGGTVKFLGKLPGDTGSYASDVNPSNEAVGVSGNHVSGNNAPNPGHAVLFKSGSVINLDKTEDAAATAINDAGKIVGFNATGTPLTFDGHGGATVLPTPTGWSCAFPFAINNNGEIVGEACDEGTEPEHDPFKYPPFAVVNLYANCNGSNYYVSSATDVNANGDVVGFCEGNESSSASAFLTYANGASIAIPTPLDQLGALFAQANGVNASDWAVGSANGFCYDNGSQEATLFVTNKTYDLNWLVPRTSGWFLKCAQDINDGDQIVGWGTRSGQSHGFLVTVKKI